MQGSPYFHNLEGLFNHLGDRYQLVKHEWLIHDKFIELCKTMDIGMQVNPSETFNIVSADLITNGVPIVGTTEIPWSSNWFNAAHQNSENIADMLWRTYTFPQINVCMHQRNLLWYTNKTKKIWDRYFK